MPSIDTSVALVVCQVRVVDSPLGMLLGLAVSDAVGCGGGGGGGGGGVTFFLQPATTIKMANVAKIVVHFILLCFTSSSPARKLAISFLRSSCSRMESSRKTCNPVKPYFQLQFGMLLEPVKVSWCCWLP